MHPPLPQRQKTPTQQQSARKKLETLVTRETCQVLVLICLQCIDKHKDLETLLQFSEQDIRNRLSEFTRSSDADLGHHLALLFSLVAASGQAVNRRGIPSLDRKRTFNENRQTYLSILGLSLAQECLYFSEYDLAQAIQIFSIFQEGVTNKILKSVIAPMDLPIQTIQDLPWDITGSISSAQSDIFTGFLGEMGRRLGHVDDSDLACLFTIFISRYTDLEPGANFFSRIQHKVQSLIGNQQQPMKLILYVSTAFLMETDDTSKNIAGSMLYYLEQDANEMLLTFCYKLLGDRITPIEESYVYWDITPIEESYVYWDTRFKNGLDHETALFRST